MKTRSSQIHSDARAVAAILAVAAAMPCNAANNHVSFTVSNIVSPDQPSAVVTLWAIFDPQWYAFRASDLDVITGTDPGWLSDPAVLFFQEFYCDPGHVSPDGDGVLDISLIQYQFLLGQLADTHNPLALWSATWTTDDFAPRSIPVWTESRSFSLFDDDAGGWEELYGIDFSEGFGAIKVVPSPGGALALTMGALCLSPRRRAPNDPKKNH